MSPKRSACPKANAWTRLKQLLLAFYGLFIRVRVVGGVELPLRRTFIVAANHVTGADSLVLQIALRTRLFFVTSSRWLAGRLSGFWMQKVCDSVPADSGGGLECLAGIRRCVRLLEAGWCVGIYPEGRLNRSGMVERVEDGCAYLSVRTGTPILPVHVRNLKTGPEPYSRPWLNEAWEGFFSVVANLFNTGIEVELGEPIVPETEESLPTADCRLEVRRINAELIRRFGRLAGY